MSVSVRYIIIILICRDYKVVNIYSRLRTKPSLPSWYPPLPIYKTLLLRLRGLGLFIDEHEDFIDEMKSSRKERGKIPTQKGRTVGTIDIISRPV